MSLGLSLCAAADVLRIDEPRSATERRPYQGETIKVDGRLDEAVWAKAAWEGGFTKLARQTQNREVKAQTQFAVLADATTVYLGVKCFEPDMAYAKARPPSSLWAGADTIEFFLAPSGSAFDFYHFAAGYLETNGRYANFASEGGVIHPDPFGPDWCVARADMEGGWSLEAAIPLASLYMSRNRHWSDAWLVNVCRTRQVAEGGTELTSWSPLFKGFQEPKKFRTLKDFPKRRVSDDVALLDVNAVISGRGADGLTGQATMKIHVAEGGAYELDSPNLVPTKLTLKAGDNPVKVACRFPGNGRHKVALTLKRTATGEVYRREYPVAVFFEEISVKLTSPQYRDNFYPGQNADRVKGRVKTALKGAVKVTLAGPGFATRVATLPEGGGEIDFDTRGFRNGEAVLTVAAGAMEKKVKVRRLAPTGHRMAWIENGRLVVDGRPTLRRNVYATGYMGGEAFREKFEGDDGLCLTKEVSSGGSLEPERVIKGLERSEAIRDVVPCKAYFDKIDAMVEKSRDKDFVYWYISDEPECRGVSPIYLHHIYEHMKEIDPYHPLLSACRGGAKYIDCADWFETHPYLNPHDDGKGNRRYGRNPADMGGFLDAFQAENRPDKCIGFLPTLFAYRGTSLLNDYPTFEEYVCHTWAAMIHGGKTLWPYAYHDMGDRPALYEGNRYVFTSFAALENIVLDATRTWLVKSDTVKAVRYDLPACRASSVGDGAPTLPACRVSAVGGGTPTLPACRVSAVGGGTPTLPACRASAVGGGTPTLSAESMFVVVNMTQEPQTAEVPNLVGTYHEFRGARVFKGGAGAMTFNLKPLEAIVATTKPRDAGLPTFAATKALVERLESERTGRDNQLLEKYLDVVVSSSKAAGSCYKLFDGTQDVIGWYQDWCRNAYVELSFPKGARRFHVVRVFGRWTHDPVVEIRKDGDWKELVPAKVLERTKNSVAYDFGACVRTVKMRISFRCPKKSGCRDHVELYEIELGRDGEFVSAETVGRVGAPPPTAGTRHAGRVGAPSPTAEVRHAGSARPVAPLWILDETNAVGSPKYGEKTWICKPELVSPREGGGFMLKGQGTNVGVKLTPETKWFTTRLETFLPNRKGYLAWSVHCRGKSNSGCLCGGVTVPKAGIYTIPLKPVEKKEVVNLSWYDYNFDLGFAYAALETEPANYALCELADGGDRVKEGATLKVTVKLCDPAEEIAAAFMCDHAGGGGQQPFAVNGTNTIVLRRADAEGRLWTGEIPVKRFTPVKHKVYVQATVLGGSLDLPLFTSTPSFAP